MTRAKRERLQPIRVMYVRISRSKGGREADTCGDSTKIQETSFYYIYLIKI